MVPIGTTVEIPENHIVSRTSTDYCGNIIYEGDWCIILTDEGYIERDKNGSCIYYYYLKDHQGNNRVVFNQTGTRKQVNHYYPSGVAFGEGISDSGQRYKYNEKEIDKMNDLNWYDYGVRHYDAAIGRWGTMDPMAEKYYSISPYAYCMNNPIKYIDPNGKDGDVTINKDKITIKVQIYIYGSGANNKQAGVMQSDIMKNWNKGLSYTDSKTGEKYKVSFDVKVQIYNKDNPKKGPSVFSNKKQPF